MPKNGNYSFINLTLMKKETRIASSTKSHMYIQIFMKGLKAICHSHSFIFSTISYSHLKQMVPLLFPANTLFKQEAIASSIHIVYMYSYIHNVLHKIANLYAVNRLYQNEEMRKITSKPTRKEIATRKRSQ